MSSHCLPFPANSQVPARPWSLYGLAAFLVVVFVLAEPHDWRFSVSPSMNLGNTDESISERINENIARQQSGSAARRVVVVLLGGYGIWCLLRPGDHRLCFGGMLGWAIIFFLGWSAFSILWSIDPPATAKRLSVLALQCTAALGLAKRLNLDQFMFVTALVTGCLAVAGLMSELVLGSLQPWAEDYRYSGLTWPAFTCWGLSLFVIALLSLRCSSGYWFRLVLGALAVVLALLTKTRTGAAALGLAIAMRISATWSVAAKMLCACGLCFVISCGLLAATFADTDPLTFVVQSINLGREESAQGFSGRAGVWAMLTPYLLAHPLCGYGYEAFWTADHLREIGERNWGAPDAHNGYINLTLGVGAVGAVAHTLVLILGMWRSRANFLATGNAADLFPGCVVLLTAVNGLSVATQLNPHFMCFASMLALARLGFVGLSAEPSCCPELTGSSSPRLNWLPAESAAQPA